MKKFFLRSNRLFWLSGIVLVAVHILLMVFINMRMPYLVDSDMASEMILGNILKEENKIITDSWFYSTEIRIINTQLVYSLFLRLSDNWHTVRMASTLVLHLILTLSVLYLCRKTGKGKYGFLTASFVLLSLSRSYLLVMLVGCYYIPHVSAEFIYLGLCIGYMNTEGCRHRKYIILIISSLIAFLAGMGGMRQIVISYFPFMLCILIAIAVIFFRDGWTKCRESYWVRILPAAFVSTLMSGAGFLVNNNILAEKYHFQKFDDIKFTFFSTDRVVIMLNDILKTFGYKADKISFLSVICNLACIAIIFMTVYSIICGLGKNASREYRILTVFFLCTLGTFLLLYAFTDMDYADRYNFPVLVWVFPLIVCGLSEGNTGNAPKYTRQIATVLFSGMIFIRGYLFMDEAKVFNRTGELKYIAEYLASSDYDTGYATFWNSNVLTELTNGKTEMYTWNHSGFKNMKSPDEMHQWLQKTEHETIPPSGKVFALYTAGEAQSCSWADKLRDSDVIYETDAYRIYGYKSYESMKEILGM